MLNHNVLRPDAPAYRTPLAPISFSSHCLPTVSIAPPVRRSCREVCRAEPLSILPCQPGRAIGGSNSDPVKLPVSLSGEHVAPVVAETAGEEADKGEVCDGSHLGHGTSGDDANSGEDEEVVGDSADVDVDDVPDEDRPWFSKRQIKKNIKKNKTNIKK